VLNVAGSARVGLLEEASDADIEETVRCNLCGPMFMARSAIPLLRRSGGGAIVNMSTESTADPAPLLTVYATAKAGLELFTRAMKRELAGSGIRVSLVISGRTATEFRHYWSDEDAARAATAQEETGYIDRVAGRVPMTASSVADALLFVVTCPPEQVIDVLSVRAAQ
jgi:NAD(P)-dependent dehydrogenase (short-subunit alcohol dehydrogenase family)